MRLVLTFERASEGVLEDVSIQTLGVPPVFGASPQDVFVSLATEGITLDNVVSPGANVTLPETVS